jgi:hypothetical protein
MRLPAVAFAMAVSCGVVTGCANTAGHAALPTSTPPLIARPLVERELAGLLLNAGQVNAAMGTSAMVITNSGTAMADNSATMTPPQCLSLDGAAEAAVYAKSGFQAERDETFADGDHFTHYLKQAVVSYPVVDKAAAFFGRSAQQWRTCQHYTHTQSKSQWSVGPITYADGVLSATATMQHAAAPGWACGRAMSLRNNVVIDVNTCSAQPADSAVKIARQIADNITARW